MRCRCCSIPRRFGTRRRSGLWPAGGYGRWGRAAQACPPGSPNRSAPGVMFRQRTSIPRGWERAARAPAMRSYVMMWARSHLRRVTFDLVHARLVLVHVPQRAQALAAMVAALKPGGWLLLEEADPGLQGFGLPGRVRSE